MADEPYKIPAAPPLSSVLSVVVNLTGAEDTGWPQKSPLTEEPPSEEEFSESFEHALFVLRQLYTFFIPLLIVLGLVGNGLSFVTFLFTRLRVRASSFYLGMLALSDFGYLFIMGFVWLDKQGVKVLNKRGLCQGIVYFSSVFSFWSVWLTVTFTAERCLAVKCPLRRLQLSTRGRARVTVTATALTSLLVNSYLLVLTDVIVDEDGEAGCHHKAEFETLLHYINITDTVVTLIVPFILIVIMNFMIGRALYLFNARRRLQRANSVQMVTPGNMDNTTGSSSCSQTESIKTLPTMLSGSTGVQAQYSAPTRLLMHPSQIGVNRMLFLVCTVFIILNLPSYVVRIHVFVLSVRDDPIPDHVLLLQRYFMLLYYTNFAVNFLLYNLGSRIFRRMMKQYLSSKWSTFSSLFRGLRTDDSSIPPTTTNASSLKANGHAVRQQKRAHDT